MSDMISRAAAMELRDSLSDIIGARPMSSIHSALSEYRKALAALPAQPAQGEADRAEIERLQRKRVEDAAFLNSQMQRAEAAEARLTALEADRVKVAETALRMAGDACEDYPSTAPDRDRWEPYDDQIEHCQHAILAITPAAVLAAVDSACTPPQI